jgi:hypothetical protein
MLFQVEILSEIDKFFGEKIIHYQLLKPGRNPFITDSPLYTAVEKMLFVVGFDRHQLINNG